MNTPRVRFGLSLTTAHPASADPQQCVRDALERTEVARTAGFHAVWAGDHPISRWIPCRVAARYAASRSFP